MWIEYNNNPLGLRVGDCVIRAISKALDEPWEKVYIDLCVQGLMMGDVISSNAVWTAFLKRRGFKPRTVEDCPECYSIEDFCQEHPNGVYVIGTGSHAVAVVNGCAFDAWNSLRETAVYYFVKED